MAVTIDATNTGGNGANSILTAFGTTTTVTAISGSSITIGVGATLLICVVDVASLSDLTWVFKCGTATMTEISGSFFHQNGNGGGGPTSVRAFGLLNPPSGAQSFSSSWSGTAATSACFGARSFKGTDTTSLANAVTAWGQNGPVGGSTIASTGASASTIPSTSLCMAYFSNSLLGFGASATNYGTTNGGTITPIDQNGTGAQNCGWIGGVPSGAGAVTYTGANGGAPGTSDEWSALGLAMNVPAAATDSEPRGMQIKRPRWNPGWRWRRCPSSRLRSSLLDRGLNGTRLLIPQTRQGIFLPAKALLSTGATLAKPSLILPTTYKRRKAA